MKVKPKNLNINKNINTRYFLSLFDTGWNVFFNLIFIIIFSSVMWSTICVNGCFIYGFTRMWWAMHLNTTQIWILEWTISTIYQNIIGHAHKNNPNLNSLGNYMFEHEKYFEKKFWSSLQFLFINEILDEKSEIWPWLLPLCGT